MPIQKMKSYYFYVNCFITLIVFEPITTQKSFDYKHATTTWIVVLIILNYMIFMIGKLRKKK